MSERRWTSQQQAIIDRETGRGALLVSAAAGSGKTAVIVERLIRHIVDGCGDISRCLVLTFTNAAAAEMKTRVGTALSQELAKAPQDKHLRRQLHLLQSADITTMHAFCYRLIKKYFHLLNISPDSRIAASGEALFIRDGAMEEVLEAAYKENNPDFRALCNQLGDERGDNKIISVVLSLYVKLQSTLDPMGTLEQFAKMYDLPETAQAGETRWGEVLLGRLENKLRQFAYGYDILIEELCTGDALKAYLPAFEDDRRQMHELLDAASRKNWDEMSAAINGMQTKKLSAIRNCEDAQKQEEAKKLRKEWTDFLKKLSVSVLEQSNCSALEDIRKLLPTMRALAEITREFHETFTKAKRDAKLLDFNDLEHFAAELLIDVNENGFTPSELAVSMSKTIDEIIIDEYQDINALQDALLHVLSQNSANLVLVGDVKQSIYRFRLSDASIITDKYNSFSYDTDIHGTSMGGVRMGMNRNFRSRSIALHSINHVFEALMTPELGGVAYDESEQLHAGATFEDENDESAFQTELHILDMECDDGADDAAEELNRRQEEARFCASRIKTLLSSGFKVSGRPLEPSDIAILFRSTAGRISVYERALDEKGIPAVYDTGGSLFSRPESELLISMLSAADNPSRDIPLVAMLSSPVFGITAEELAAMHAKEHGSNFFGALKRSAADGNEKSGYALRLLYRWRELRTELKPGALIRQIYDDTSMPFILAYGANDDIVRKNLYMIAAYADNYATFGRPDLNSFLKYVARSIERGDTIAAAEASEANAGAVSMMTIHRSKGLEFPVVILADTASHFNKEDLRSDMIFHDKLGVGLKYCDVSRGIRYPTLAFEAVGEQISRETASEELRLLYVAMTRAKEKLIISASFPKARHEIEKLAIHAGDGQDIAAECNSMIMWLLLSQLNSSNAHILTDYAGIEPIEAKFCCKEPHMTILFEHPQGKPDADAKRNRIASETHASDGSSYDGALAETMSFIYPRKAAETIPSKLTATQLKGLLTDYELLRDAEQPQTLTLPMRQPAFIHKRSGLTPSERGTALHLALQLIDLKRYSAPTDVPNMLSQLVADDYLSEAQREAISARDVAEFLESPLGKRVRTSCDVRREFKFSLLRPAADFYPDANSALYTDEKILFQGIIDCFFREDDNIVIIDYKSDRVTSGSENSRAKTYDAQIKSYARAAAEITGLRVSEAWIYFTHTAVAVRALTASEF